MNRNHLHTLMDEDPIGNQGDSAEMSNFSSNQLSEKVADIPGDIAFQVEKFKHI